MKANDLYHNAQWAAFTTRKQGKRSNNLSLTERCDPSLFATRGTSGTRRPVF